MVFIRRGDVYCSQESGPLTCNDRNTIFITPSRLSMQWAVKTTVAALLNGIKDLRQAIERKEYHYTGSIYLEGCLDLWCLV